MPDPAQEPAVRTFGLYDRPTLVLDPGMHTGPIRRADVDAAGGWAVTGSTDKTVRIWSVADGWLERTIGGWAVTGSTDKTVRIWSVADGWLERTIRLPAGPGDMGKVFAVAIDPKGELVAAGGWTRSVAGGEQIYLSDRASGALIDRIEVLPDVVYHLTFSQDGRYLAATLGAGNGLRVYDREDSWAEIARDTDYGDYALGAAFAPDGRLATTSYDGRIRLYDGQHRLLASAVTTGRDLSYGIAFSPDGSKLAVGFIDTTSVELRDGHTLAALPGPDSTGIDNGDLMTVAWSADGSTLYAAGQYWRDGTAQIVAWREAGLGERRELLASQSTVMTLAPLPDGGLLVAAQDPYLAVLAPDGVERWAQRPRQAALRGQRRTLAVSADGQRVDFGYLYGGDAPARFDLATLRLSHNPAADGTTAVGDQTTLPVKDWKDTYAPTLNGARLPLDRHERSRSLAVHPDGVRFALGTNWSLRAFDANGEQLWRQAVPGVVCAVNITGDGRMVVAAYSDGTIRWHRIDGGQELLAFLPLVDQINWVAWTPEGIYAATAGAHGVLRWHVNRGWDAAAHAVPVSEIPEQRRPEVLRLVLQEMDWIRALGLAEADKIRRAIQLRTNSAVKPGAQLHVVAVGVSDYNAEHAKHLRLEFADRDAHDLAAALSNTQGSLYAKVNLQCLRNEEATRKGVFQALATVYDRMQSGQGDLAVFHFSGHGALVDGSLYLLPQDVDAREDVGIKTSAIEIGQLRAELHRLAERGRVLVLVDACRSGAASLDQCATIPDAGLLRAALATVNVTVLTSSSGSEVSREDPAWANGAFTEVLLRALGHEADINRDGLITVTDLARYVAIEVPRLTEGRQTPGMEVRFEDTIFAAGL